MKLVIKFMVNFTEVFLCLVIYKIMYKDITAKIHKSVESATEIIKCLNGVCCNTLTSGTNACLSEVITKLRNLS